MLTKIHDISDCLLTTGNLRPSCAEFSGLSSFDGSGIYRTKVPIRSYKVTADGNGREVLVTLITPTNTLITNERHGIRSTNIHVENQRYCYRNQLDYLKPNPVTSEIIINGVKTLYNTGESIASGQYNMDNVTYSSFGNTYPAGMCFL